MKKILLMNGPNLNMLGIREPGIYGSNTLASLHEMFTAYGKEHDCEVECFQSNHEGELVEKIHATHGTCDGIVYNPGAHTHYSYALRDALGSVNTPASRCISPTSTTASRSVTFPWSPRRASRRSRVAASRAIATPSTSCWKATTRAIWARRSKSAISPARSSSQVVAFSMSSTKANAAGRLARLRQACDKAGIRTFFVRDTSNIAWLTAFDDVFDDEQAHALLVTPHDAVLHTDSRYSGAAPQSCGWRRGCGRR